MVHFKFGVAEVFTGNCSSGVAARHIPEQGGCSGELFDSEQLNSHVALLP